MNKRAKTAIIAAMLILSMTACSNEPAEAPAEPTPTPVATAPAQTTEATPTPDAPETAPESTFVPAVPEQKISFEQAMEICQTAATNHLGAGTLVLPDFDGNLIEVTYDGKVRPCYVFIAGDAMSLLSSANKGPQARYVVDTTNGDVYDSISLQYIR